MAACYHSLRQDQEETQNPKTLESTRGLTTLETLICGLYK